MQCHVSRPHILIDFPAYCGVEIPKHAELLKDVSTKLTVEITV